MSDDTQSSKAGITVGLDGTAGSSAALSWAIARTANFGPIKPVLAWNYPLMTWLPEPFSAGAPSADVMQAAAEVAALAYVDELDPSQCEEPVVRQGDAGPILVEESAHSAVLVVGSRGRSFLSDHLLGSVSRYCADHTTVPLVIVPSHEIEPKEASQPVIDVGVDDSEHSETALRWAVAHSQPTDAIVAHSSWHFVGGLGLPPESVGRDQFRDECTTHLNALADRVCDELGVPRSRIERSVEEGDPRTVLRKIAETSDLLVVGSRGRTGLSHFFLGSTTTALIHRPPCPIAIIPDGNI